MDPELILAFIPSLFDIRNVAYRECDEYESRESPAVQQTLHVPQVGDSDDEKKEKLMRTQRRFYIVDEEALDTGYILWVHFDQFGNIAQRNRVKLEYASKLTVATFDWRTLEELVVGYRDGKLW